MTHKYVIVSRHQAAIDFIRANDARFLAAPVITGNATPADVSGRHVAGNLPLSLASICVEVVAVEFTGNPPRGAEYTAADMVAAGARLESYVVKRSVVFEWLMHVLFLPRTGKLTLPTLPEGKGVTHGTGDAY